MAKGTAVTTRRAAPPPPAQEPGETVDTTQGGTQVAISGGDMAEALAKAGLTGFTVARHVTLPLLKVRNNVPYAIQVMSPIYTGRAIEDKKAKDGTAIRKPAELWRVKELMSGNLCEMIVNEVLKGRMSEEYPERKMDWPDADGVVSSQTLPGYVGRFFAIYRFPKAEGKDYHTFQITELTKAPAK